MLAYSIVARTRFVNLPFNSKRSLVESKKHKVRMDGQNEKTNKKIRKRKMHGKRTKYRGLSPTQQPRDIPLEVVKEGLLTITRHKKVPQLPVTEGRWQVNDKPRPPIPRHELITAKLLGFFETIKVDELV